MKNNIDMTDKVVRELDVREQVFKYLRHWPWFVFSVILFLILASLYLRYANPIFNTNAAILIKDDANRAVSEVAVFQDLGITGGLNQSSFENEIQILKSKSLTERVVRNLDLNVSYFVEGSFRSSEIFENNPIKVVIVTPDSLLPASSIDPFYISPGSDNKFQLLDENKNKVQEYSFGDIITTSDIEIQVNANSNRNEEYTDPIKVVIRSIPGTVASYQNNIVVEQMTKLSSIIQLTLNAPNRKKSEAILNELIEQYNEDAIIDRNLVARNTDEFIRGRLVIISEELDSVETGKVAFKQSHRLTDMQAEGVLTLQRETEFDKALLDVEVQIELIDITIGYLQEAGDNDLLPLTSGSGMDGIAQSIDKYNQVVLDRSRQLAGSTERNPNVMALSEQIRELRSNILEGLRSSRTSLELKRNEFLAQQAKVDSKISTSPSQEKIFRSISRQQELKEALYLYLLQKREENAISMAVTTPKAKVVDYAYSSLLPVSPNARLVLLGSFMAGLIIPFVVIYFIILLDNKIRNKFDIEYEVNSAPVIGEIPRIGKKDNELVKSNDRSIMAESFRILSTNLEYLFVNDEMQGDTKGRVILVTSTIKGEGKTFVSSNLAVTLANTGAKVLLVGGDLRNPQIHRYAPGLTSSRHKRGIVEYLIHKDTAIEDFIEKSDLAKNLDMLFSGTIPPNPAELLLLDRVGKMFEYFKTNYDYVIVDTAPAMLVTDTFLLRDYADATVYVTRAGFTQRHLLGFADESIRYKKLKNVAFVINNVKAEDLGYGSKYGYYYSYGYGADTKRTFFGRLQRVFGR